MSNNIKNEHNECQKDVLNIVFPDPDQRNLSAEEVQRQIEAKRLRRASVKERVRRNSHVDDGQ